MSMKKSLVSALTTALVVGAASTTFAAANPFEDVPADHWAYDAISQLAADGVIEGYGDGTYRGDQEITRYEMAQMIARAMAKNPSGADKAMVDKLAAEFADELNNLGVRVAALEKKVDNVKWHGLFRYTWLRTNEEKTYPQSRHTNNFRLRLSMTARVNEHWTANGRMEYGTQSDNMKSAANTTGGENGGFTVNRLWAAGEYGATTIWLGKFPGFSLVDNGMIFEDDMAGGFVQFGNKAYLRLTGGRYKGGAIDGTSSYWSVEASTDPNKKFSIGAGYHHFENKKEMTVKAIDGVNYNAKNLGIWAVGAAYRFDKNVRLSGAYAQNTKGDVSSKYRRAWFAQLDYKGADPKDKGSWGAFLAYRHLGELAAVVPTYDSIASGQKGAQIGLAYTILPNIVGQVEYYLGKRIENNNRQNTIFSRVSLYF